MHLLITFLDGSTQRVETDTLRMTPGARRDMLEIGGDTEHLLDPEAIFKIDITVE